MSADEAYTDELLLPEAASSATSSARRPTTLSIVYRGGLLDSLDSTCLLVDQRLKEMWISDAARKGALHVHDTGQSGGAADIVALYVQAAHCRHARGLVSHSDRVALAALLEKLSAERKDFDARTKWEVDMQRSYLALACATQQVLDGTHNGLLDTADWPPLVVYKEYMGGDSSQMGALLGELVANRRHLGVSCVLVTSTAPSPEIRLSANTLTFLPSAAPSMCVALWRSSVPSHSSTRGRLLEISIRAGVAVTYRPDPGWSATPAVSLPTHVPGACALRVAAREHSSLAVIIGDVLPARPFPNKSAWARMLAPYVPEAVSLAILLGYCAPETRFWAAEWLLPGETLLVLSAPLRVFRRALHRKFDATHPHVATLRRRLAGMVRAIAHQTETAPDVDGADVYVSAQEAFRCGCLRDREQSILCCKCWGAPQISLEILHA